MNALTILGFAVQGAAVLLILFKTDWGYVRREL